MNYNQIIESTILELSTRVKEKAQKYPFRRQLFQKVASNEDRAFKAIIGPRGVGKTILLAQLAQEKEYSVYISADSLERGINLFELVKALQERYGFRHIFIDEIHVNLTYQKSLKNIYDFLDVKIYFTSSMALSLVKSAYDLSRRVQLFELHLFSFWEYLKLLGHDLEPLSFQDLIDNNFDLKLNHYARFFNDYLTGGALPYSRDVSDLKAAQKNVIDTVVEKDIPLSHKVNSDDIFYLKKAIEFIALAQADGVNVTSLSKNLTLSKHKAQKYIEILTKAFILNSSTPYGSNIMKEPKILMYLPNRLIYSSFEQSIGALREDFATSVFRYLEIDYHYLKTTRGAKSPDFYFQVSGAKIVCEIGGKNKGHSQFKGLKGYDKKIVFRHTTNLRPGDFSLHLLGLVQSL